MLRSWRLNWAKTVSEFRSINSLTSEKLTDMGNSATFYSVLVEVELSQNSDQMYVAESGDFQATQFDRCERPQESWSRPQFWTLSLALPYNCSFLTSQRLRS